MIQTWAANIEPLMQEACYEKYYLQAPKRRQEKADRLKQMKKKAQSIGVWSVYAQMRQVYQLDETAVFNFSHSGSYVLCSVSVDGEKNDAQILLGCDVEKMRAVNLNIAKHFFCESEYQYIVGERNEEQQKELFYRYWVLKESFMKATRKGMAMEMNSFEIRLGNPSVFLHKPEEFSVPFYYMETELGGGAYRVAVCSTDAEIEPDIRVIQLGL